jgi:hypothetical protein
MLQDVQRLMLDKSQEAFLLTAATKLTAAALLFSLKMHIAGNAYIIQHMHHQHMQQP